MRLVRRALATAGIVIVVGSGAAVPYAGSELVVSSPVPSPDAIVSLASHEWERLPATVELARRYPHALVLLTLPRSVNQFNCHDCAHRVERLTRAGIEAGRIRILPLTLGGTYGEAVATRNFVTEQHLSSVLVVTSPYHTRRSLATFRQALSAPFVRVGVWPASETSPAQPDRWWAAAYDRAYVRYEWAAILYYRVWHHVPIEAVGRTIRLPFVQADGVFHLAELSLRSTVFNEGRHSKPAASSSAWRRLCSARDGRSPERPGEPTCRSN